MAIKFRCPICQQFLGISESQAGQTTECPTCYHEIQVPTEEAPIGKNRWSGPGSPVAGIKPPTQPRLPIPREAQDSEPVETPTLEDPPVNESESVLVELEEVVEEILDSDSLAELPEVPSPPPDHRQELRVQPAPSATKAHNQNDVRLGRKGVSSNAVGKSKQISIGIAAVIAVISALLGGVISESLSRSPDAKFLTDGHAEAGEAELPEHRKIRGVVTYASATGQSNVDRGALILALPLYRQGVSKIAGDGIRIGADAADINLLKASVIALGGNIISARDDGSFLMNLPAQGRYGLLVISRSQSRPINSVPTASCRRFLENYFEKPDTILGTHASEFREVVVDGTLQASRAVHFVNN